MDNSKIKIKEWEVGKYRPSVGAHANTGKAVDLMDKANGGREFAGIKTVYAKPGESFSGGPIDVKKIGSKLGEYSPTRELLSKPKKSSEVDKSDLAKDWRGTYVPGQGFAGNGAAVEGSPAHQSKDKASIAGVKDIVDPLRVPKHLTEASSAKTGKNDTQSLMRSMMEAATKGVRLVPEDKPPTAKSEATDKGYALGEGPKGGMYLEPPKSKGSVPKKSPVNLSTAPPEKKQLQFGKATPMEIPSTSKSEDSVGKGEGAKDDKWISDKISLLMHEGKPQKQAIAIAHSMAGRSRPEEKTAKSIMDAMISKCAGAYNALNRGRAQTSVDAVQGSGNDSYISKAVTSMCVPRMPRALAASLDQWRDAPNIRTSGLLNGDLLESVGEVPTIQRPVMKACSGCGRTYTLRKSDDGCPSCSSLPRSNMAKSRGGMLIPSSIKD